MITKSENLKYLIEFKANMHPESTMYQQFDFTINQLQKYYRRERLESNLNVEEEYPLNLYYVLLMHSQTFDSYNPEYVCKKIENLDWEEISFLTQREKEILLKRFKDNKTLKDIAQEYGVTKERIKQIVAKVIRKLAIPYYTKYIIFGKEVAIRDEKEALENLLPKEEKIPEELNKKISELIFSTRTLHCLNRYGIYYLNDLVKLRKTDLFKIRNLGRKSYNEIIEVLDKNELKLKEEE